MEKWNCECDKAYHTTYHVVVTKFFEREPTIPSAQRARLGWFPKKEARMSSNSNNVLSIAKRAREASFLMQSSSTAQKDKALRAIRESLSARKQEICAANAEDKRRAEKEGCDANLRARLNVEGDKFETLLSGISVLEQAEDLVNRVTFARELTAGLNLYRISCPIGVVCIVFESRPEAAVQISSLAIKSGNCVILKGGKEAALSNQALVDAMRAGLVAAGLPEDAVQLVSTRAEVGELLKMNQYIDLVVPRGSNQLVTSVMEATSIPVLGHADGICSVFIDESARKELAVKICVDSKTNYPAACNAAETLLVHAGVVDSLLPEIGQALAKAGVTFVADKRCFDKLPADRTTLADPSFGFNVEHLSLRISVKCMDSLDDAISHINAHGSHHTDVIVTENEQRAADFCRRVDSAGVYHNCSSRFADGFRYGFGAELGVSTNRVHARGPVGMEGLLTYKYVLKGDGQIVGGMKNSDYTHKDLDAGILNKPFDFASAGSATTNGSGNKKSRLDNGE